MATDSPTGSLTPLSYVTGVRLGMGVSSSVQSTNMY